MVNRVGKYKFIGPWEVAEKNILVAEKLLKQACFRVAKKEFIVMDVPAANPLASTLLAHNGFNICGTTTLMYRGVLPQINRRPT